MRVASAHPRPRPTIRRPRGRPPKDKLWDEEQGRYVNMAENLWPQLQNLRPPQNLRSPQILRPRLADVAITASGVSRDQLVQNALRIAADAIAASDVAIRAAEAAAAAAAASPILMLTNSEEQNPVQFMVVPTEADGSHAHF